MTWTTRPRSEFGPLAAIRAGAGPRLVLLHGVGLRAEAWNAQMDALSPRFEVIAPDLPGHGSSARIEGQASLGAYVDRVAGALAGPFLIVGHSMGAMIALELAALYPDMVRGVAALNAIFRRTPAAAGAVQRRAAALDGMRAPDPSATLARWFGAAPSAEAAACREWLSAVDPAGYKAAYTVFANEDGPSDAGLAGLAAPALFLTGSEEPNSTPAMSAAMAARAPGGRSIIIDGAAHMAPMTHPEPVNAALIAFSEECSA